MKENNVLETGKNTALKAKDKIRGFLSKSKSKLLVAGGVILGVGATAFAASKLGASYEDEIYDESVEELEEVEEASEEAEESEEISSEE